MPSLLALLLATSRVISNIVVDCPWPTTAYSLNKTAHSLSDKRTVHTVVARHRHVLSTLFPTSKPTPVPLTTSRPSTPRLTPASTQTNNTNTRFVIHTTDTVSPTDRHQHRTDQDKRRPLLRSVAPLLHRSLHRDSHVQNDDHFERFLFLVTNQHFVSIWIFFRSADTIEERTVSYGSYESRSISWRHRISLTRLLFLFSAPDSNLLVSLP